MVNTKDILLNVGQRLNRIRKEFITWLNGIGALLALYAFSNPVVNDKLLFFIPEEYREVAGFVLPIAWFWLVQKGKEVDKARTIAETRLP